MNANRVIKLAIVAMCTMAIISATNKTTQKTSLNETVKQVVAEAVKEDSLIPKDTVFMESGLTIDPRKSDSAKVHYLMKIGYFDSVRVDECLWVLVPKPINKLVTDKLNNTADSVFTADVIRKIVR